MYTKKLVHYRIIHASNFNYLYKRIKKQTVREEARQVEELQEIAKNEEPLRFEIR